MARIEFDGWDRDWDRDPLGEPAGGWSPEPRGGWEPAGGGGRPFADGSNIELPGLGSFAPGTPTERLVEMWRDYRFGGIEPPRNPLESEREPPGAHWDVRTPPTTSPKPPATSQPPSSSTPSPGEDPQARTPAVSGPSILDLIGWSPEYFDWRVGYASGSRDIDELRAEPWTTEFEQAALARADELVNERYKALREQKAMELASRGILPGSGLWEREMGRIDRAAAREMADFRRELQLKKIDLRQQRLAQARAIEAMMESMERQRLFDLLAMLSGDPNYALAAGQLVTSLVPLLGQQAAMFGSGASQAFGNLGDLFAMLLGRSLMQQPQINI